MDSGCGDTYQDCDSFCGPSFKMQRHQPVYKARRHCNTWLASDESQQEEEEGDGASLELTAAPAKTGARRKLPTPPRPALPGASSSSRRRRAVRSGGVATDSTASDCSGRGSRSGPEERRPPDSRVTLRHEAIQKDDSSVRTADWQEERRQGHRRQERRRQQTEAATAATAAAAAAAAAILRAASSQPTTGHRSAAATAAAARMNQRSGARPVGDEEPIDYMEVYHRLRIGRFGYLYNFPSFGNASPAAEPPVDWRRRQPGGRRLVDADDEEAMAAAVATAAAAAAAAAASAATAAPGAKLKAEVAAKASTTRQRQQPPAADGGTDLEHLLRLLREGGRRGGMTSEPSPLSESPTPLPVPKPRQFTTSSQTASSRSEAAPPPAACDVSHRTASAASARSATSGATRQTLSASLAPCGPFESVAVCEARPFESPRRCCLAPTLVTPTAERAAPVAWQRLSYRCADWLIQRRLSVTGCLLDRHHGAAPCRWLGSAALLTHLRHPSRVELPFLAQPPVPEAATAAAETVRAGPSAGQLLCVAPVRGESPPSARFAFHAMNSKRRRRQLTTTKATGTGTSRDSVGESRSSGRIKSNLYAVSAS